MMPTHREPTVDRLVDDVFRLKLEVARLRIELSDARAFIAAQDAQLQPLKDAETRYEVARAELVMLRREWRGLEAELKELRHWQNNHDCFYRLDAERAERERDALRAENDTLKAELSYWMRAIPDA